MSSEEQVMVSDGRKWWEKCNDVKVSFVSLYRSCHGLRYLRSKVPEARYLPYMRFCSILAHNPLGKTSIQAHTEKIITK